MPRAPVTFGAPTALSHKPTAPPPDHYAGLVNPYLTLKTMSGGYTVTWGWAPENQCWIHSEYSTLRTYYNDGTYEVKQGAYVMETGTWKAVA